MYKINGIYLQQGGLLMTLGGILEFVLGNTFAFVVFCSYGMSFTEVTMRRLLLHSKS